METYLDSLTSICSPLLVVQGVGKEWRPVNVKIRERTAQSDKYQTQMGQNFGVQLDIHRELDDVTNEVVGELVNQLESVNTRGKKWWPRLNNSNNNLNNKLEQQSLWFNIMYTNDHYDLVVNGSQSMLSPYRQNGKYFNSMVPLEWMSKYYDKIPIGFISIYELSNDDEYDDILINEILRMKQQLDATLTKFYCLIYTNGPIGEERSNKIRLRTELVETNSLFFVTNVQTESTVNDRRNFISKLLLILKRHSNDFFNNQIKKLKIREAKNASYPEILFTTRFLIKFSIFELIKGVSEYSTNLIIRTQSKLMKLLIEIKDLKSETFKQIKIWIDIFTIHLIRSIIIMGSFNKGYQNLKIHINLINKSCGFDLNWVSNQFTWFAQILEYMGNDLVPLDYLILPNDPGTIGGKTPHVGFIYLEALRYKEMALLKKNPQEGSYGDNRLLLLNGALDMFSLAKHAKFNRIESMIYIKIGDIYFNELNFSMAINNYKAGLSNYGAWSIIKVNVMIKLLECFKKMGNWIECWKCYSQLISQNESIIKQLFINNSLNKWQMKLLELKDGLENVDIINIENNLLNIECIIKNDKLVVGESIELQLRISKFDLPLIEELKLDELDFSFNNEDDDNDPPSVEFKSNNKEPMINFHEFINEEEEISTPFSIPLMDLNQDKEIIIQYTQKVFVKGEYSISDIKVNGEFNGIKFRTGVKITYPDFGFWREISNMEIQYPMLKCVKKGPIIKVNPRVPKIGCLLKYDEIGYNGQSFPILIEFKNEDDLSDVKIHITGNGEIQNGKERREFEVNFLLPKDDDSDNDNDKREYRSEVLKRGENEKVKCFIKLPQIFGLPYDKRDINCKVKLNIKYLDGGSITEILKDLNLTIVELFKIKSNIMPVLNTSMMLDSGKIWKFKINITNLSFDDVVINGFKVNIKSLPEVDISYKIEEEENCKMKLGYKSDGIIRLQIEIRTNSGYEQLRSLPIEITGEIQYNNNESFIMGVFNGRLPHNECRVLVDFHYSKISEIEYTIENPTEDKIHFQTNLSIDNNETPIKLIGEYPKSMNITMDPHSMKSFNFKYEIPQGTEKLPEFTVFDKNNNKFKKILSVSDSIEWDGNHLFYKGFINDK